METWTNIIGAVITASATLFSVWLGHRYYRNRYRDPVVDDNAQSSNVYTALDYTMEAMKSDRAYVLEFHNGGHYYSGRGQQKFSCTHEMTRKGITNECTNSQEHRVSNFHAYITELIENKKFAYLQMEGVPDHAFAGLLENAGVLSIYNVPIKTLNGKIIGILGVDYVRNRPSEEFSDEDFTLMRRQARVISGYLV